MNVNTHTLYTKYTHAMRHAVVLSIPKPAIWCIKFCSSFFSVQCTLYRVISTLILWIDVMSFDAADDIITTNYLSYYFDLLFLI